ncbi:hypothetical protein KKE54_04545, partial [bacterium]|nr:hypothetical protein [bacterium]
VKTAAGDEQTPQELRLESETAQMARIAQEINWTTDDPLGIGGLLSDALILTQLVISGKMEHLCEMLSTVLTHTKNGMTAFMRTDILNYPSVYRLAFRELGLSIGLHALDKIQQLLSGHTAFFPNRLLLRAQLEELTTYLPLCAIIENFWLEPENQKSATWSEHLDINSVMLATSLGA